MAGLSPIDRRYRLPPPTWHGAEQCFYQLQRASEDAVIDLCVFERSRPHQFFVRQRHGDPVVLFDPHGLVRPVDLDAAEHGRAVEQRLADLRARFHIFQSLVTKEIRRGRATDAMNFYQGLTIRPLVDLLRIRHAPERFDFGLRYLDADLPHEAAAQVRALLFVQDLEHLASSHAEAVAMFDRTLAEIDSAATGDHDATGDAHANRA